MPRVVYAPGADDDILGIADYIAHDKPEAARRWIVNIRRACETLVTQPEMGELRSGFGIPGCRSFSVGSYVIFFRPSSDAIEVARIVHGSRDIRIFRSPNGTRSRRRSLRHQTAVHEFQLTNSWIVAQSSRRFGMDAELCGL